MSKSLDATKSRLVTQDQLEADLKSIGLRNGDRVAVTLSFKSVGHVQGGANAFIDALLAVVGENGTIMMNTYTPWFPLSKIPAHYIFDVSTTPPETGLVPRTFLRRKDVIRSKHPACSVAAFGKLSRYLTENHDEKANLFLPYERLAQAGGKYLCIGLGNRLVAIRHEAQRRAGYFDFLPNFMRGVLYKNKNGEICLFTVRSPPCVNKLDTIVPKIEKASKIKRGKIGNADTILAPAGNLIEAMTKILKEQPELTLCDDFSCVYCRELERRKNLYRKIKNPKLFQRNLLIIKMLTLRNKYVMKRSTPVYNSDSVWKKIKPEFVIALALRRVVWLLLKLVNQ
jgi:aminoglycoside 3-N-acetyltransferase